MSLTKKTVSITLGSNSHYVVGLTQVRSLRINQIDWKLGSDLK